METANSNICSPSQPLLKGQTIRLTKRAIQLMLQSPYPSGKVQIEISDSDCRGLKVLISRTGIATYYSRFHLKHKRFSKRLGEFPVMNVESARKNASAYRLSVQKGEIFVSSSDAKITFVGAMNRYGEHSKATKKSSKEDLSKIKNHLTPFFKKMRLSDVTPADIKSYLNWLKKKKVKNKERKDSTIDRHISLLMAMCKFFISKGWLGSSFMESIKTKNPDNSKDRYLSTQELGGFMRACRSFEGDPFRVFELLAATGMRISEGLSARLDNWDIERQVLILDDSKTGKREVVLNPTATRILELQYEKYGGRGLAFRGRFDDRPMSRPNSAWKKIMIMANLNDGTVTPHTLRHTFCSHLLMAGVDQFTVSKLMGLKSTYCVQRHYGHLSQQMLAKTCAVITDVINKSLTILEE